MNRTKIFSLASVLALGLAASVLAATCPGPDTFGHECINDPPGACTFLPTSTVAFTASSGSYDDWCRIANIGWTFTLYGTGVTQVGIGTNGQIVMGSCTGGTDFSNDCPVPSPGQPNGAVFGVWDDLRLGYGDGSSITYGTSGTAPDRVFAVTYNNVPFFYSSSRTTFQVQLHENDGAGEKVVVSVLQAQQTDYTTGIEQNPSVDGLSRYCNNGPNSHCTEYSMAPPATGDCDLTEIEAKLDDEFRFTDDDELAEVRDEVNAQLAALEAKLDDLAAGVCDVVRLLHTPSGIREADCGGQHYDWNQDGTVHD